MPARMELTIKGVTKSLAQWSRDYKISKGTVYDRIHNQHMDPIVALTTPVKTRAERLRDDSNDKCRKCKYRAYLGTINGSSVYCEYMYLTNTRRPCKGGAECTEFKEGPMMMKGKKPPIMLPKRGGWS